MVLLAAIYVLATGSWRHRFDESAQVPFMQKFYFMSGLLVVYAAVGSPISFYGHHYMFSMHMLQQSLLYLVAPPLILLGIPGWMLRPLFRHPAADRFMKLWSSPLIGIFTFNIVFSFYHIPKIMNTLMANEGLLYAYNTIFLLSAFQMWFPIFSPLPEYSRMSGLWKMAYIFINGILLTPACALIIFADDVLYNMYKHVPADMVPFPPLDDQQLGGVIMKIVQEFVYGIALAYSFFRWYRLERNEEEEDLLDEPRSQAIPSSGKLNQA
jgi:putative membrane protein